jgi:hypothetical protein
MINYKNVSYSAKTFYGVKFEPGEIHPVPGYINDPSMIRIFSKGVNKDNVSVNSEQTSSPRRGRKKSNDSEEVSIAQELITDKFKEETSNGNPS